MNKISVLILIVYLISLKHFVFGQELNVHDRLDMLFGLGSNVSYYCKIYYYGQVDSDMPDDSIQLFVLKLDDLLLIEGEDFTYLHEGDIMIMVYKKLEIIHLQKAPETYAPPSLLPFGSALEFETHCSVCSKSEGYKVSCFAPNDANISMNISLNTKGVPLSFTSLTYNPESPFPDDLILVKGFYFDFSEGNEIHLKNYKVQSINDFIVYSNDYVVPTNNYKDFEVFYLK